jgi:ubiquinone/menaquinone biosynthesis C-methylase UbiE
VFVNGERIVEPEILDHAGPEDTRECLRDLARLNRYFGGHSVLRGILSGFAGAGDAFSLLDVGAASGDSGAAIRRGYPLAEVVSLDRLFSHLDRADHPKLAADAFHLPFRPASFDFVFSSLFLHHFSNDEIVQLLSGFRRVARRAVLAIDLDRGPFAFQFLPATQWLFGWNRVFVHDGKISVQAALKQKELHQLATRAGLANARVRVHRPWSRLSLVAPVSTGAGEFAR